MKRLWLILSLALLASLPAGRLCRAADQAPALTLILGAFDEEIKLLEGNLQDRQELKVEGLPCVRGKLQGREVVISRTGVGKVNAAMTATLLITRYHPSEVVFTGVAGGLSPGLGLGDIIIAKRTAQHDLGKLTDEGMMRQGKRNPFDGRRNPIFYPADPRLLRLAEASSRNVTLDSIETDQGTETPKIRKGIVVTGDVFVASEKAAKELHTALEADAVEMEGAAVAQVCWQLKTPCLIIRSICDLADKHAARDSTKFYKTAASNSARFVMDLVKRLNASGPKGK